MELAYIAGFFDGEGTVGIYKVNRSKSINSWMVRLSICGAYRPSIVELKEVLKYGSITTQKRQALHQTPSRTYEPGLCKQGWRWTITNKKDIKDFLEKLRPYLREKADQADIVLDFINGNISGENAEMLCKLAKKFEFSGEEIFYRTDSSGSNNPVAKLNEEDVIRIKNRLARGESQTVIAKEYNINKSTIYKIAKGISWTHVKVESCKNS
jgi:hypothetical protein